MTTTATEQTPTRDQMAAILAAAITNIRPDLRDDALATL